MWRCCTWSWAGTTEAIAHFKTSLALKPQSAAAHYNLGTALTVARRLDEAAAEYREALRIDPAYANAHNNLGNVLLAQRQFDAGDSRIRGSGAPAAGFRAARASNLARRLRAPPAASRRAEAAALAVLKRSR